MRKWGSGVGGGDSYCWKSPPEIKLYWEHVHTTTNDGMFASPVLFRRYTARSSIPARAGPLWLPQYMMSHLVWPGCCSKLQASGFVCLQTEDACEHQHVTAGDGREAGRSRTGQIAGRNGAAMGTGRRVRLGPGRISGSSAHQNPIPLPSQSWASALALQQHQLAVRFLGMGEGRIEPGGRMEMAAASAAES